MTGCLETLLRLSEKVWMVLQIKLQVFFNANTPKQTVYVRRKKPKKEKIKKSVISEENKERIKDRISRYFGTFCNIKRKKKKEKN